MLDLLVCPAEALTRMLLRELTAAQSWHIIEVCHQAEYDKPGSWMAVAHLDAAYHACFQSSAPAVIEQVHLVYEHKGNLHSQSLGDC